MSALHHSSSRLALMLGSALLSSFSLLAWQVPPLPETALAPPTPVPAAADPRGYPDPDGFRSRADAVVQTLGREELGRWRRGYFTGGDPGKYLTGAAIARLLLDPADADARLYLNDDRSYREHYHFAAVNWARFYPLFGAAVLTPATQTKFADALSAYNYLDTGGTENHRTMWMTSANILPAFVGVGTNRRSQPETLAEAKRQLHQYVKGLYLAGPGEWDSPTYLMFTVNGLLNIYDFSSDPDCRLLAQAGLDLLVAGYALKYTDGAFCAPNQRGHVRQPHESIADQTGFVWWGSHAATASAERPYRYAMHAITSAWRPGPVLTAIARRELTGLPAEQRNSKANYWYGQKIEPHASASQETLWVTPQLTMGSLWNGHASQHSRFMIAASTPSGAAVFTGGHPRQSDHLGQKTGLGFRDGTGRYLQSAQLGDTFVALALVPDDDEADYAFFAFPTNCLPEAHGTWQVFRAGDAVVAVHPLTGNAELGTTTPDKQGRSEPLLRFPGRRTGFFVVVGGPELLPTLETRVPDTSRFLADLTVGWRTADGHPATVAFNPDPDGDCHGDRAARFALDGAALDLGAWPIFGGPFVRQTPGRLAVTDGRRGFTVDFTGELPRYGDLE